MRFGCMAFFCNFALLNKDRAVRMPSKYTVLLGALALLFVLCVGCNRKYTQAGDKKKAYKRKYKCKMCVLPADSTQQAMRPLAWAEVSLVVKP